MEASGIEYRVGHDTKDLHGLFFDIGFLGDYWSILAERFGIECDDVPHLILESPSCFFVKSGGDGLFSRGDRMAVRRALRYLVKIYDYGSW